MKLADSEIFSAIAINLRWVARAPRCQREDDGAARRQMVDGLPRSLSSEAGAASIPRFNVSGEPWTTTPIVVQPSLQPSAASRYTRKRRFSDEARHRWVPPDIAAIGHAVDHRLSGR
jgi:hypothetical protein